MDHSQLIGYSYAGPLHNLGGKNEGGSSLCFLFIMKSIALVVLLQLLSKGERGRHLTKSERNKMSKRKKTNSSNVEGENEEYFGVGIKSKSKSRQNMMRSRWERVDGLMATIN